MRAEAQRLEKIAADIEGRAKEICRGWAQILRGDASCRPPELVGDLIDRTESALLELGMALASGPPDLPGDHFRQAVRDFAFMGSWLASSGASPTMAARYVPALGEALADVVGFDAAERKAWRSIELGLQSVVMETFCLSVRDREQAAHQEVLEKCTPVLLLPHPRAGPGESIPVLVLVGSPRRQVISMLGQSLLLTVARCGAQSVVIDFSFARDLKPEALDIVFELALHRKLREKSRRVLLCGLDEAAEEAVRARPDLAELPRFDDLSAALAAI